MKRILLSISFLAVVAASSAQDQKFHETMKQTISMMDSSKTTEDLTDAAAKFERIANAETTQWLPYYYAAVTNIFIGFRDDKANKDALADKADGLISKAMSLQPKNADIYLAKSMSATLHMIVDPMNRWQKYGADSREALMTAKQLDPNNPRPFYWEGQTTMNTPEQFGGGKKAAMPMLEKSVALFKTYKPAGDIYPNWGEKTAQQALEASKSE